MTWTNDAMLKTIKKDCNYAEYTYDISGNRLSKNVNGVVTEYITDGEILLGKNVDDTEVWYIYNDSGKVIGLSYKGDNYYYQKDIFNSVRNLIDINGNVVCSYQYDAWGKILEVKGDKVLAKINDFRYQSYIYDEETKFYYLKSRYYDPENYRFINADSMFSGTNLFTYCANNPTNYCDPSGKSPIASVYGSSIIFVSDWGYEGIGFKPQNWNERGGVFYKVSTGIPVFFNCYLWALNRYYNDNTYSGPGMYADMALPRKYSVSDVYNLVKADAGALGYGFKVANTPNASVSSGQRLIALRTTTANSKYYINYGGWDYHFMKKVGNTWTFKGGRFGRIYELANSYTPSSTTWDIPGWDKTGKRWCIYYYGAYTSAIKYFILTY